jgi:hypothetical protein
MKILLLLLITLWPTVVLAQNITSAPQCLTLINKTASEVLGHIETDSFTDEKGKLSWHRQNFKLAVSDSQEFCSTGPFFNGPRLRLVVKSLFPLYSCLAPMGGTVDVITQPNALRDQEIVMTCPSEKAASSN